MRKRLLWLSLATVVTASPLLGQQRMNQALDPHGQENLARALHNGPNEKRRLAVIVIKKNIPADQMQPYLYNEIIAEAARLHAESITRRQAIDAATIAGKPLPPDDEAAAEYVFSIADLVADHHDPVALQTLMLTPFFGTGKRVMDAIAGFGEDAAQEVIIAAGRGADDPSAGMLVLKRMLELPGRKPLSDASKRRIVQVAADRLRVGNQSQAELEAAIRLAVATRDPTLREQVKRLASDDKAALDAGARTPRGVKNVHLAATQALQAQGPQQN